MACSIQVRPRTLTPLSSDDAYLFDVLGSVASQGVHACVRVFMCEGKKQDVWFVVDPETGEKQTSLTTSSSESICPNTPLLYIGRTGSLRTHTRANTHTSLISSISAHR